MFCDIGSTSGYCFTHHRLYCRGENVSYARFGWGGSDVYVFMAREGLECCGCLLQEREWVDEPGAFLGGHLHAIGEIVHAQGLTTTEMVAHLRNHEDAGHSVPSDIYADLWHDRDENEAMRREALGVTIWNDGRKTCNHSMTTRYPDGMVRCMTCPAWRDE